MDIVNVFLSEHEHIRSMLGAFENELERFEQAKQVNYDILGSCISYCTDYLDQWHHPREDMILEVMVRRDPDASRSLHGITGQHEDIARWTTDVERIFHDVSERGAIYLRDDLVNLGRKLSDSYRHHLAWEEKNFFPAAETILTEGDWQDVATKVKGPQDPLALTPVDRRYHMLLAAIADQQAT